MSLQREFLITQVKSSIGCSETQLRTLEALGLRGINHAVVKKDTPANRGQIRKVQHLVRLEIRSALAEQ